MTGLVYLGKITICSVLGYLAAPYGPFPMFKNMDFEPAVFLGTAALGAWVLLV